MTAALRNHPVAVVTAAYAALTVFYTWPLLTHLGHGVVHDAGDPILNTWILWWDTQAVPLTARWWNAPMFYPAAGTFAFSEHLLGLALVSSPIIALRHNPLLGYNVALLASYLLCALGGYFLGLTITGRHDAAFVAGLAYGFAPYRLAQLPHIQVLASGWTPICLASLHRYDATSRRRWAAAASAAWLMQGLSNGYFLFFLSALVACWLVWFALARWPLKKIGIAAAAWIPSIVVIAVILIGYQAILRDTYGFSRGLSEIQVFSADVLGVLNASGDLLMWGWLHVWWRPEGELFPGLTVVVLAAAAVAAARPFADRRRDSALHHWGRIVTVCLMLAATVASAVAVWHGPWRLNLGSVRLLSIARPDKPITLAVLFACVALLLLPRVRAAFRRRSPLAFYLLAAAATWVCTLGPDPLFMGRPVMYQAPYGQLMHLPGFNGFRVPARFWAMTIACLSAIAALAVNRVRTPRRTLLVAIAAVGILLDGWPHVFQILPPPDPRPLPPGVTARLELPASDDNALAGLYRQMSDAMPLYNGYSGYLAPQDFAMRELLSRFDQRILGVMTASWSARRHRQPRRGCRRSNPALRRGLSGRDAAGDPSGVEQLSAPREYSSADVAGADGWATRDQGD